jgi:hypothetical protein
MPAEQFDSEFMEALESHPDWRLVFLTNKSKMLVNVKTEAGETLFMSMLDDKAKYPDEFSKSLSAAHTLLLVKDENARQKGLELAMRAFEIKPSQMSVAELLNATRYPEFKPKIVAMLKEYLEKFEQNKDQYARQNGYNNKLIAALIDANYFQKTSNDPRLIDEYRRIGEEYRRIQAELMDSSRW